MTDIWQNKILQWPQKNINQFKNKKFHFMRVNLILLRIKLDQPDENWLQKDKVMSDWCLVTTYIFSRDEIY